MTTKKTPRALAATRSSAGYKDIIFHLWYKKGQPTADRFYNAVPADEETGFMPSRSTLHQWMAKDFRDRAEILDIVVQKQIEEHLIREKIAMLNRHAELGEAMQNMGAEYLKENTEKLTPTVAVRLLVEGWRIERESKGIPAALEKVVGMSDADLLGEVEDIINAASVTVESD